MKPGVECTCPPGYLTNRCPAHTYGPDEEAPSARSSSPQSDENASGVVPVGVDASNGSETRCGNCGLPTADCPETGWGDYPLAETYPGSGIYE